MTTDSLAAGREVDVLVAEKVMGLARLHLHVMSEDLRPYSTDIAAAWEVVEHMRTRGVRVEVGTLHGGGYSARASEPAGPAYTGTACASRADTAPLAICKAVLGVAQEQDARAARKT
jgi:Phage ABA sandwich domain